MVLKPKHIISSNAPLKALALIAGYFFWHLFGSTHLVTMRVTVPLSFYDVPHNWHIAAPESVEVQLRGSRPQLYALQQNPISAHISAQQLIPGKSRLLLDNQTLFLPDSIKLVHYTPSHIIVTHKNEESIIT